MNKLLELNAYSDLGHKIETFVKEHKCDYLDAIITYSELNNLELEAVAQIISKIPTIKLKLEIEAEELRFLKKTPRVPV